MEISGKIKRISEPKSFGSSGFTTREWVIVTSDQYPQEIQLECHQDKCDLLNSYQVGQDVKASINVRGKMWTSPTGEEKYFNTLVSWRIEATDASEQTPLDHIPDKKSTDVEQEDDLPF